MNSKSVTIANPLTRYLRKAGANLLPLIEDSRSEIRAIFSPKETFSDLPKISIPSGTMEIQAGNRSLAKGKMFLP
jgi:hypothetical protein